MTEAGLELSHPCTPYLAAFRLVLGALIAQLLHLFALVHASDTLQSTRTLCANCPESNTTPLHTELPPYTHHYPATASVESAAA